MLKKVKRHLRLKIAPVRARRHKNSVYNMVRYLRVLASIVNVAMILLLVVYVRMI